jgi:hypothetical protein
MRSVSAFEVFEELDPGKEKNKPGNVLYTNLIGQKV